MTLSVAELDALAPSDAAAIFTACCGSSRWTAAMVARRPFLDRASVLRAADEEWQLLSPTEWLEAFAHHPRIGESRAAASVGTAARQMSESEQSKVATAEASVKTELAAAQLEYEARFGYIFLICATGKSAAEILAALRSRMANDPETELRVAAEEQRQITQLRLTAVILGEAKDRQPPAVILSEAKDLLVNHDLRTDSEKQRDPKADPSLRSG